MPGKLNAKQERFVREYLVDVNATQAAIRCGYSRKTAKQQGSRLLTNVAVEAAIAKAQGERAERVGVKVDDVLAEIKSIAFAATEEDGLRYADKLKALELLGKHLKLFVERHEHEIGPNLAEIIAKANEAAR